MGTVMVVCGDFRCVVLISRYAVKLPRPKWWRFGRRCNRWEREMWQVWRPRFPQWGGLLCPILFGDRFGLIVLMRRACTPIAQHDFTPLDERPFPDTTTEVKSENLGWLDGHVVEIDYALADQNTINEQRAYYTKHARSSAAR